MAIKQMNYIFKKNKKRGFLLSLYCSYHFNGTGNDRRFYKILKILIPYLK